MWILIFNLLSSVPTTGIWSKIDGALTKANFFLIGTYSLPCLQYERLKNDFDRAIMDEASLKKTLLISKRKETLKMNTDQG